MITFSLHMPLKSCISLDCFVHIPTSLSTRNSSSKHGPSILFFIPGNPGLISFYHAFLSLLATSPHESLSSPPLTEPPGHGRSTQKLKFDTSQCIVAGFSLGGFEVESSGRYGSSSESLQQTSESTSELLNKANFPNGPLYTLREQIELTLNRIRRLVSKLYQDYPNACVGGRQPRIILLGHSVGSYIALEVIRLCQEEERTTSVQSRTSATSVTVTEGDANGIAPENEKLSFEISGAILLTPTIVDIAKSPSGRLVTPLLTNFPFYPSLAQHLAHGLIRTLPDSWLRWVVAKVTGMPDGASNTVIKFLQSERGVKEALSMAADEMREIGRDLWPEEVWGSELAEEVKGEAQETGDGAIQGDGPWKNPKLVLYFAYMDHWVADVTRDEIVKAKGRPEGAERATTEAKNWKTKIVVEQEGKLVHAWCIHQSAPVAEKVRDWVVEMVGLDA